MQIRLFMCKQHNILVSYMCYFGISNKILFAFSIFFLVSIVAFDLNFYSLNFCLKDG